MIIHGTDSHVEIGKTEALQNLPTVQPNSRFGSHLSH